jgi:hypothetical protein
MNVWRINLKPGSADGVDPRKLCLDLGIVGVGWQIEWVEEPISWEIYEKEATELYYNQGDRGWWPALNAMYNRIQKDDLIWTRDWQGIYYIGRILGDWYYETSKDCEKADIVNVRKCDWQTVGTIEAVPGKLVNSFIPARTVQIVNDETINLFSQILYNQKSNLNYYEISNLKGKDIYSLLSSDDCEDALALYLQVEKEFMLIPSSCKSDTMNYEFELKHRQTGKRAIVQVKNGYVDLNSDNYNDIDSEVFLFTTKGEYYGQIKDNIHFVEKDTITDFLYNNIKLLPDKMKMWIELIEK